MGCCFFPLSISVYFTTLSHSMFPHSFVQGGIQMVYGWNYVLPSKWLTLINIDMW